MNVTSRELVVSALELQAPLRIPRQLWTLPWAERTYPSELAAIREKYPDDILKCPPFLKEPLKISGDEYAPGLYVDEWGCRFENRQWGVIGEVKDPLLKDWKNPPAVRIPEERLSVDTGKVDEFCRAREAFVYSWASVNLFERLQFIRGPENLYLDLAERPDELFVLIEHLHTFFKEELELWASTEVDALFFADDWGSQKSLLISPALWREVFKPLYRDYVEIAHRNGKYAFMHSDGHITDIFPDLIEIGVDAVNSQVFCMDLGELGRRFAGKITFWGEIDRQHVLPYGTPADVAAAVNAAKNALYRNGGVIAQCEFGIGARPENVAAVFETWDKLASEK
jgi:uroporphyrinogen decarboxylase